MWLKTLYYFGLLILPSMILGQWIPIISNGMEKLMMPKSQLMECYSGPIIWSNCFEKGQQNNRKLPMVYSTEHIYDCPGVKPEQFLRQNSTLVPPGCSYNPLVGKWDFQKDSMHTSRPNTFPKDFSKNEIKRYIRRIIRQEMRKNRDYYYDSADTYNDQQ